MRKWSEMSEKEMKEVFGCILNEYNRSEPKVEKIFLTEKDLSDMKRWVKKQNKKTGECKHCGERCILTGDKKCA